MRKLIVSRWTFDGIIGDHIRDNLGNDYEFFQQAKEQLEIRKLPQIGGDIPTMYVNFGGDLASRRDFSDMYGVPQDQIIQVRDLDKMQGLRARLKPINQDYFWSLLNWNHKIHGNARAEIYRSEQRYGSADG